MGALPFNIDDGDSSRDLAIDPSRPVAQKLSQAPQGHAQQQQGAPPCTSDRDDAPPTSLLFFESAGSDYGPCALHARPVVAVLNCASPRARMATASDLNKCFQITFFFRNKEAGIAGTQANIHKIQHSPTIALALQHRSILKKLFN